MDGGLKVVFREAGLSGIEDEVLPSAFVDIPWCRYERMSWLQRSLTRCVKVEMRSRRHFQCILLRHGGTHRYGLLA